jgi:hypothetical protein
LGQAQRKSKINEGGRYYRVQIIHLWQRCNYTKEQRAESHDVEWGGLMYTSQTLPNRCRIRWIWMSLQAGSSLLCQAKCQFAPVPVRYSQFQFPSSFLWTQRKSERGRVRAFSAIWTPDPCGPRQCVLSHAATSLIRFSYQIKTRNP